MVLIRFFGMQWIGQAALSQASKLGVTSVRDLDREAGPSYEQRGACKVEFLEEMAKIERRLKVCVLMALGISESDKRWPNSDYGDVLPQYKTPASFLRAGTLGQTVKLMGRHKEKIESSLLRMTPSPRAVLDYLRELGSMVPMLNEAKHQPERNILKIDVEVARVLLLRTERWYVELRSR